MINIIFINGIFKLIHVCSRCWQIQEECLNLNLRPDKSYNGYLQHFWPQQIQASHLNLNLQISPFSISLKKSLVKDKSGNILLPPYRGLIRSSSNDVATLAARNLILENDMRILQRNYEDAMTDCQAAHKKIDFLQK